jgi:hypothetical protein
VQDSAGVKVTDVENIVNSIWTAAGSKAIDAIFVGQIANWNMPGPDIAQIDARIQADQQMIDDCKEEIEQQQDIAYNTQMIEDLEKDIQAQLQRRAAVGTKEIYQQLIEKFTPQQQIEGEKFTAYIVDNEVRVAEGGEADTKWEQYKKQTDENIEAHQEWMEGNIYSY